jgi:hypothetical protein
MDAPFKAITGILQALYEQEQDEASMANFLTLLSRLSGEIRDLQRAAKLTEFGRQFTPAGEPVEDSTAPRQYQPGQQVYTHEGYLGYIAGYNSDGKAVVNVVFEGAEYPEAKLSAIPGAEVLLSMMAGDNE